MINIAKSKRMDLNQEAVITIDTLKKIIRKGASIGFEMGLEYQWSKDDKELKEKMKDAITDQILDTVYRQSKEHPLNKRD